MTDNANKVMLVSCILYTSLETQCPSTAKKTLVHYTGPEPRRRANAAVLIGAYAVRLLSLPV